MDENQDRNLIMAICAEIERIEKAKDDVEKWRYINDIISMSNQSIIKEAEKMGVECKVMYVPIMRSIVILVGDLEYQQSNEYRLNTQQGRAKVIEGILDMPFLDALMRISGYKKIQRLADYE